MSKDMTFEVGSGNVFADLGSTILKGSC